MNWNSESTTKNRSSWEQKKVRENHKCTCNQNWIWDSLSATTWKKNILGINESGGIRKN